MLQRCSSNSTPFSILFSSSMEEAAAANYSSVDCTLSLGTPSTRHSAAAAAAASVHRSSCSSTTSTPSFCWDIISHQSKTQQPATHHVTSSSSNLGGDPVLLARRCANCDTTSTPLWRNGPRGPKSLCNACGIRYKKEERRAAAAASTPSPAANLNESIGYNAARQYPWSCYSTNGTTSSNTSTTSSSSRCQTDEDMDQVPYLSWRLNVVPPQFTDRPSLFQYQ